MESVLLGVQRPQNSFTPSEALALPAPRATRDRPRRARPTSARRPPGACSSTHALMPYHRLIVAVVLVNAAVLVHHLARGDWRIADGSALSALVRADARQPHRRRPHPPAARPQRPLRAGGPRARASWPLWVRWSISKVHHVGGIHVGARARRHRLAVRLHGVAIVARGARAGGRLADDARPRLRARRARAVRRRSAPRPPVRSPRAQRVRADATASAAGRRSRCSGR